MQMDSLRQNVKTCVKLILIVQDTPITQEQIGVRTTTVVVPLNLDLAARMHLNHG